MYVLKVFILTRTSIIRVWLLPNSPIPYLLFFAFGQALHAPFSPLGTAHTQMHTYVCAYILHVCMYLLMNRYMGRKMTCCLNHRILTANILIHCASIAQIIRYDPSHKYCVAEIFIMQNLRYCSQNYCININVRVLRKYF